MQKENTIEVDIQYSIDDFVNAWKYYRSSHWIVRFGKFLAILFGLFGLFLLLNGYNFYALFLFLIAIETYFDILGQLQAKNCYRANKNLLEDKLIASINEEGISIDSPSYDARRLWSGYIGFMESEDAFLLFSGKGIFSVYPKRIFNSPDQINQFRELITRKIGEHGPGDKSMST
jgi:hypothetical protein